MIPFKDFSVATLLWIDALPLLSFFFWYLGIYIAWFVSTLIKMMRFRFVLILEFLEFEFFFFFSLFRALENLARDSHVIVTRDRFCYPDVIFFIVLETLCHSVRR